MRVTLTDNWGTKGIYYLHVFATDSGHILLATDDVKHKRQNQRKLKETFLTTISSRLGLQKRLSDAGRANSQWAVESGSGATTTAVPIRSLQFNHGDQQCWGAELFVPATLSLQPDRGDCMSLVAVLRQK